MATIADHGAPEWSLTGINVVWPNGQSVVVTQSPWIDNGDSWTSTVSIPIQRGNGVEFATVRITVARGIRPALAAWLDVRDLIERRMCTKGQQGVDLGVIAVR